MHALWHWLLYLLTWAAHDPATLAAERARCAGAVAVAYAALAVEPPPPPAPRREAETRTNDEKLGSQLGKKKTADFHAEPKFSVPRSTVNESLTVQPCPQCGDTGRVYRSDGGYVRCPCGACPTGRCPTAR